ncbi:hypothetical protein Taro_039369 [Colocasia esculenta]|uniref:Uncharacterized protein n=1 Tax=Colocasia esculenta TaxID=4460 RepID=A0A843W962_COLES|nr:hypothetical protein [Colocasia esculenta]
MSRRLSLDLEEPLQGATTSATRIISFLFLFSFPLTLASLHVAHTFPLTLGTNIMNVTVELSSFGRPKKEKLEPHLRPLREATTTTWSKYFLGHSQPSQPGSQPTIHHRQRETSDVREHPEDIHRRQRGHGRRRNGSSIETGLAYGRPISFWEPTGGRCNIIVLWSNTLL